MKRFLLPLCIFSAIIISWDNFNQKQHDDECIVNGKYSGNFTSADGHSLAVNYEFGPNNFAAGTANESASFGSFTNNCKNITISVRDSRTKQFYLLKGTLSDDHMTIKGSWENETVKDEGDFVLQKQ